jgi:hypothetical protein
LLVRFVAAALIAAQLIPWTWERREDLRFLGDSATVAYYAGIVTLRGYEVDVDPRRNPLLIFQETPCVYARFRSWPKPLIRLRHLLPERRGEGR